MKCQACGHANSEGRKFCSECGVSLLQELKCPKCGTAFEEGEKFCGECGTNLTPDVAPSPAAPTTRQPTSFAGGRYEVKRFLGEGANKRVYLAHDTTLDRDVAFALIKTEGLDEQARHRITREAQAMGRLGNHPHIVSVYDVGEEDGQPYLILPLLTGGDVKDVIEKTEEHKLPIEQVIKIATETCQGLEFSHSKGIIHRDLKPGNIWLAEDGRAMLGAMYSGVPTMKPA